MKKLRSVTEAEVIAEFLQSEFHEPEFRPYRQACDRLVRAPDLSNDLENSMRRVLLFRRRGHVWRELPADTQWWEVTVDARDISNMRVFTRGHWAKLRPHQRQLPVFARLVMKTKLPGITDAELAKLRAVRERLQQSAERSSILLLGVDEDDPITILEGNNRMTAALLMEHVAMFTHFRFYAGISPQMHRCVFYQSNWSNLARYGWHRTQSAITGDRTHNLVLSTCTEETAHEQTATCG